MRRRLIIASIILTLIIVSVGAILFAINRTIDSRTGPVHRFPVHEGKSFLTDERAAAVAREVMNRDGYPESSWKLMEDDRTKAPDGRPDRYLTRNAVNPNQASVLFYSANSPTAQRFVNIELRGGQITAQGTLGK